MWQAEAMIKRIVTVGGFALLLRVASFVRDIILTVIPGPAADVLFVVLRLPNQFRAIFTESAFNAADIRAYARIPRLRSARAATANGG